MSSSKSYISKIVDPEIYNELNKPNQKYIMKADKGHEDSIIYVSSSFIIGKNEIPKDKDIGIKYLMYGTELHLPKVMEQYGTHLLLGEIMSKNEEEGIRLLNEVTTIQKDSNKKLFLVDYILKNETYDIESESNGFINFVLAKQILKEAADMGNAQAMDEYGKICCKSKKNKYGEINADFNEAFKYYKMASKKGYPSGMTHHGLFIRDGIGGAEIDIKEAQKLFKEAYEKGDLDGCAYYGNTLIDENFGNVNEVEGLRLIKYACDNGSPIGIAGYAYYNYYAQCGFKKNDEKAFKYYKLAAEHKSASALKIIGDFYRDGNLVEKDIEKAIKYYELSYENGEYLAANALGEIYDSKEFKEFYDLSKAQKYYKFAFEAGYLPSLCSYCLALCYDKENLDKNIHELRRHLILGEQLKDTETMCLRSVLYLDGDIFSKNNQFAISILKECADLGSEYAMEELIKIYEKGFESIKPDPKEENKYRKMLEKKTMKSKCCLLI